MSANHQVPVTTSHLPGGNPGSVAKSGRQGTCPRFQGDTVTPSALSASSAADLPDYAPVPPSAFRPGRAVAASTRVRAVRSAFGDDLVRAVAVAGDLHAGVTNAVAVLRRDYAIGGVEWWIPTADGASLRVEFSCGDAAGPRVGASVGAAGVIVLVGDGAARVEPAVARLRPVLHHWWTAERLAEHVTRLARKNEALEDFAALVAHDVKSSLVSALRSDAPGESLSRALEIVDSILEATCADGVVDGVAPLAETVREAVADLGDSSAEVFTSVTGHMPMPAASLRLVVRNLLANAVAAGARTIHISAVARGDRHVLVVADDGVGLGSTDGYASGARMGIALCRRLLARFGGTLTLKRRGVVGTRATIVLTGAPG
jgi:signal transduction histidine kinase